MTEVSSCPNKKEENLESKVNTKLPLVILISPGVSDASPLCLLIEKDYENMTVKEAIKAALDSVKNREEASIADRIRGEYTPDASITINGKTVSSENPIKKYLVEQQTPKGNKYLGLNIVVARPQEGGCSYKNVLQRRNYEL